jgi:ABC-2 type transport system ATP-binding protein
MEERAAAIEIRDLCVDRGGRPVLIDVSVVVERGKVTGLLGPSGSGKSTLIRAIVGVQQIAAGAVRVLGVPAGHRSLRSRVGYVTQAPSVYPDLTVGENLRYFARIYGRPADRAVLVAGLVGLGDMLDRVVARLSGGQRARVSLASALINDPEVLVLDEPTVGLDPVLRRDLWAMFKDLANGGVTLLVSSHVMDEAERCDSLLLMRDGRILAGGSPGELRARTHAADIEGAFLRLVEAEGAPVP